MLTNLLDIFPEFSYPNGLGRLFLALNRAREGEWDHAEGVVQYGLDRLQRYERNEKVQNLESALRKMSAQIAQLRPR